MADDENSTITAEEPAAETESAATAGEEYLGDAGKQALDRMKAERTEAVRRAKALERELEQFRQASMSEAERAVAEAESRGRTAAMTEFGARLARSEFAAAAARRNPDFDVASALDLLDVKRFVRDDGEPDTKSIATAVERLVPAADSGGVTFAHGPRTTAQGTDMNNLIRRGLRGG